MTDMEEMTLDEVNAVAARHVLKLTPDELTLLRGTEVVAEKVWEAIAIEVKDGVMMLDLHEDDTPAFCQGCIDGLARMGFDEKGHITEQGRTFKSIIDKIFEYDLGR